MPHVIVDPFRVAVVGSGPAGFYAAGHLLSVPELRCEVDMFDRLATPWGLVRAGVAPDHPKIKSVTRVYERTASSAGFRLRGNVEVGTDLSHAELAAAYHAVIYATGAPADRRLSIPGESLPGSHAATEFVGWYNGHPDHVDHEFDLSTKRAVVIGNGNVALDVARMLSLTPRELQGTDIADHALAALARSAVEDIVVIGRRGPTQAAYTGPELRELTELEAADVVVDPKEVEFGEASEDSNGPARRTVEILRDIARSAPAGKPKTIVLRFLASPLELLGSARVEGVRVVRNELVPGAGDRLEARPTAETEEIRAGLVLRSIGSRGTPIPGLPFDEDRATIHNERGRVIDAPTGDPLPGTYAAGWIKRGPSGVIGTNKRDARETVDLLLDDLAAGRLPEPTTTPSELLDTLLDRRVDVVDYAGWEAIDAHERRLGAASGRPRIKMVRRSEQLRHAAAGGLA